jgi:GAF domain-containing protein
MTRETEIMEALLSMADTLVDDFDVVDLLTALTDRCVNLLNISAAGVMLAGPDRDLRLIASSSDSMRILELFELQEDEGPCLDAYRSGEAVEQLDLQSGQFRWPRFAPVAIDSGYRSVLALPLRLRQATIGALNLFNESVMTVSDADLVVARAFADLAAISVIQHRVMSESQLLNEQLAHALQSRITIEQAKGVISERAGIDLQQAFGRLRGYARNNNLLLTDVARSAIDGTLSSDAWSTAAPPGASRRD